MLEENRSSVQRRGADHGYFCELDSVPQHSETRAELSTAKSAPVEMHISGNAY